MCAGARSLFRDADHRCLWRRSRSRRFDPSGTLWYSANGDDKIRGIAAADMRVSGLVTKYLTLGGVSMPGTIPFDAAGNLWVADAGLSRFPAAKLGTNRDVPEIRRLSSSDTERTVTRVALDCGFEHVGRFALLYRARFGESPSETRARVR